jgi:hypothetical protein
MLNGIHNGRVSEVSPDHGIVLAWHINTLNTAVCVCIAVKSAYSVCHVCLSACISVGPNGWISMKFDLQIWLKSYKILGTFCEDPSTFYCCP